jgi:hypothetical protein
VPSPLKFLVVKIANPETYPDYSINSESDREELVFE